MIILADILGSTILFGVPLLLVALGGMFAERSGIINLALEGIMITGALFGCLFLRNANLVGWGEVHPQLAMLVAILLAGFVGALFSILLSIAAINLKANQTISGTALNQFAPAFAVVFSWAIQGRGQTTINIPSWIRITTANFGFAPSANPGFWETFIFKSFYLTTPVALILFIASYVILYKTRLGLRLRACGEHPQAAASVGVNVYKMRYIGTTISGFLGGIGGLAFTIAAGSSFQSTVAGYGFLALAVMIFGNWKPVSIFFAANFFAFFKVISSYSSNIPFLPKFENIKSSSYIYQCIPYVVTMLVLIFTSKRSQAPLAEGQPYDKGQR
ncbi:MAG: ABC transporter permease [Eubacteriales bacterium]|nr:ABC transporter permease [Eubacteriales bacterium]